MEKIVRTKTCRLCKSPFDITNKDVEFYEKISPIFNGTRYLIPMPTLCPPCRHQRRISFRNERKLYKRDCDLTGKKIISIYSPDKPYKVYDVPVWESDAWDAKDFGRDFDFGQGFFPQLFELSKSVPHISRYTIESSGADYINGAAHVKDSYLCFNVDFIEDSAYCFTTNDAKKSFDCSFCKEIENCYSCHTVDKSHTLFFSSESQECSNSYYLSNCLNCHHCFGCVNLANQKYCIYNKQYTQEEYKKNVENILASHTYEQLQEDFTRFKKQFPKRQGLSYFNTNSLSEYSRHIKDSSYIFDSTNIENSKYAWYIYNAKDCMDYDIYGDSSELVYEAIMTGTNAYKNAFCYANWMGGRDCYYCILVIGCKNCFGCVGLKNQQYCIFNKQYTKEEYETLVPRIIEHMKKTLEWGEFFPGYMAPCGYNESVAQDYFPLTKEEAEQKGYYWGEFVAPDPAFDKIIPGSKLPNSIKNIPDDVLNWAIECQKSKKLFRITKMELDFYRKYNFPLPKLHPDERHLERLHQRNPKKFFIRKCNKCGIDMQTTYAPDRPEKVYCEKCYNEEIY